MTEGNNPDSKAYRDSILIAIIDDSLSIENEKY